MSENEKKNNAEQEQDNKVLTPDTVDGKPLDKPTKEFWLISGIKAIGRGVGKAIDAVGGFVSDHPWAGCAASCAIGVGGKILYDRWMSGDDEDDTAMLPEADEDEPVTTFDEDVFPRDDEE